MQKMTSTSPQHFLGPKMMPFMALALMAFVDVLTGGFIRESFLNVKIEYVAVTFMAIAVYGVANKESSKRHAFVRSFSRQKL